MIIFYPHHLLGQETVHRSNLFQSFRFDCFGGFVSLVSFWFVLVVSFRSFRFGCLVVSFRLFRLSCFGGFVLGCFVSVVLVVLLVSVVSFCYFGL